MVSGRVSALIQLVSPFVVGELSTMLMDISAMFVDMNVGVGDTFIIKNNCSVAHALDAEGDFLEEVYVVGY